ncbi:TraX family protein [Cohnella fermenti]|uniref:Conjugal transfer protein TraX n=1 Tax=Cohnella fermenti TaxID=2565925 RepID=A0A4S4BFI1_9BACL|nr:TraX family protein [Cohnella fermenti]THF72833.1 conjugal transfer protein TraX [Cohnella fermenti]
MQIIAMLTMLVDHTGILFFPGSDWWRIVGRIAFPLYAYGIVLGFGRTRDRSRYLSRLLTLALISQVPYMLGFQIVRINVIGTFVVCLAALIAMERFRSAGLWAVCGIAAAAAVLLEWLPFEYGAYAMLLILTYRFLPRSGWVPAHLLLNVAYVFAHDWEIQLYSLVPTIFLAYGHRLLPRALPDYRVPAWLWRSFYPAHLFVLAVIAFAVNNAR